MNVYEAAGYGGYDEYIASRLWLMIRSRVLNASRRCVRCGERATQVHHGNYAKETLLGKDLDSLYPVCRDCHKWAHRADGFSKPLSAARATKRLLDGVKPRAKRVGAKKQRGKKKKQPAVPVPEDQMSRDLARLKEIKAMRARFKPKRSERPSTRER